MTHGIAIRIEDVPHQSLNPNRREHFHVRRQHAASLRASAALCAKDYLVRHPWEPPAGRLAVELFVAWDRHKRRNGATFPDDDNLIASCKPLFDGLAAALGVNDRRFKIRGVEQTMDPDGIGFVVATITPWED